MIRISKLTDYALVLVTELSHHPIKSAKELSVKTKVPFATANKVLKLMQKSGICDSKGGKTGGFYLTKTTEKITVLDVIQSIEGNDNHLIDCHHSSNVNCAIKGHCQISKKMNSIDLEIQKILSSKTVADLL